MSEQRKRRKTASFGACSFDKISPRASDLKVKNRELKALNVFLTFQEALKLNLAVDEAIRKLNAYDHATKEGKAARLKLTVHLDGKRIVVFEK